MDMVEDDAGRPALYCKPAFEPHFGTFDWRCMRCGLRVSQNAVEINLQRFQRAFQRDPSGTLKALLENDAKATKLIEKINRLGGAA